MDARQAREARDIIPSIILGSQVLCPIIFAGWRAVRVNSFRLINGATRRRTSEEKYQMLMTRETTTRNMRDRRKETLDLR